MEADYKKILLSLIGSLTLADHLGDVWDDVSEALDQAGFKTLREAADSNYESESYGAALAPELHKIGVTTLYGTSLGDDE